MGFSFVCLAARDSESRRWESTPGYVKLLLPPRQSRGNSYWGLANEITAYLQRVPFYLIVQPDGEAKSNSALLIDP